MNPSDVFRKRNFSNVNFDYEDLIGRNLSDTNMKGGKSKESRYS